MQSINVDRKCDRIVGLLIMALNNERAGLTALSLIQEAIQLGDELYQYQQAKENMSASIDWRIGEYEQFRFLTRLFDVCAAKRQIATHPRQIFGLPMDTFKSWVGAPEIVWLEPDENGRRMADNDSLGMISIDWDRAKEADLSVPVIVACMIEDNSSVHNLVIDGWHRIARATLEGIDVLPAVVLLPNETAEIMNKQEKEKKMRRLCYLETSSYVGLSFDATHTYGVLKMGEYPNTQTETIQKPLSAAEVDVINQSPASKYMKSKVGDLTSSFNSEKEVIKYGIDLFNKVFNDGNTLLILGDRAYAEPQKVLVGPEEDKKRINAWVQQLEVCKNNGDEEGEEAINDMYWKYLRGIEGE